MGGADGVSPRDSSVTRGGRVRSVQCASVCLWSGPVGARSLGGSDTVCGRERGLDGVGCALARGLPLCHAYLSNSDYVFTWQCRLSIAL